MRINIKRSPDKLIKRLGEINKNLKSKNSSVVVGLPAGSNDYPAGTSVIAVGIVHEFGSPAANIPARPFLRTSIKENRRKYLGLFKMLARKMVDGKSDMETSLKKLGAIAAVDVQSKITDIKTPPLRNRVGNPLIDTGHMRQSITYEVRE